MVRKEVHCHRARLWDIFCIRDPRPLNSEAITLREQRSQSRRGRNEATQISLSDIPKPQNSWGNSRPLYSEVKRVKRKEGGQRSMIRVLFQSGTLIFFSGSVRRPRFWDFQIQMQDFWLFRLTLRSWLSVLVSPALCQDVHQLQVKAVWVGAEQTSLFPLKTTGRMILCINFACVALNRMCGIFVFFKQGKKSVQNILHS